MAADASRSVDTGAQIAPRDVCTVRNQYGEAVPLCLIDACGVCEAPVWLDAWPSATPYSWPVRHSTCARDARDAPDPYWDAELWEHVASVATERRMAHGTRWWTSADVHVAPATAFHGSEWAEDSVGETRAEEARHKLDEMQAETKGCAGVPNLCRAEAVNRVVHNAGKAPYTFRDGIGAYVIPAHGAFLATDLLDGRVCGWEGNPRHTDAVAEAGGVDLVVMDPPWPNQSAERRRRGRNKARAYATMDIYDLWRVRPQLESILSPDTLVAVWVTNHVQRFVRDKFLPGMGRRCIAAWAWAKLTTRGELLLPLRDASFRKPYELLLIGSVHGRAIPPQCILASVALGHSAKPDVADVLLQGGRQRVVELFARGVAAGRELHVSVGNEPVSRNEVIQ